MMQRRDDDTPENLWARFFNEELFAHHQDEMQVIDSIKFPVMGFAGVEESYFQPFHLKAVDIRGVWGKNSVAFEEVFALCQEEGAELARGALAAAFIKPDEQYTGPIDRYNALRVINIAAHRLTHSWGSATYMEFSGEQAAKFRLAAESLNQIADWLQERRKQEQETYGESNINTIQVRGMRNLHKGFTAAIHNEISTGYER